MSYLSLFLIAFSLSMDAFAVSISAGLTIRKHLLRSALILGAMFGVFQAIMPLIGWLAGISVRSYIEPVDHWIAFLLLGGLGIHMIHEAMQDDAETVRDYLAWKNLFVLGVATSIDALAIGISLALLPVDIWQAIVMIGSVTFFFCFLGVLIGSRSGHIFEKKAEIIGGVILIIIGSKILIEHLFP